MTAGKSNAELLLIIAETLGLDPLNLTEERSGDAWHDSNDGPPDQSRAAQLSRMVRAFQALPDEETRLLAIEYVEAMGRAPLLAG